MGPTNSRLGKEKTDAKDNVSSGAHANASANDLLSGFVQRRRDLRNYSKTELWVMLAHHPAHRRGGSRCLETKLSSPNSQDDGKSLIVSGAWTNTNPFSTQRHYQLTLSQRVGASPRSPRRSSIGCPAPCLVCCCWRNKEGGEDQCDYHHARAD